MLDGDLRAHRGRARPSRSSGRPARASRRSSACCRACYDPPPGTVFIDGVDVRDLSLAQLRGAIGFVPQEPFLFSETIADNIAFGVRAAPSGRGRSDERVDVARRRVARLDKDVAGFPNGYDTMVGERGITLSGGQKQRTALARALLLDPRILVLDDALSAVDTYTEEEILARLRGVMRERTSIIVSHRVSTVRDADQILVLEDGAIVGARARTTNWWRRRLLRGAVPEAAAGGGAGRVVTSWQLQSCRTCGGVTASSVGPRLVRP